MKVKLYTFYLLQVNYQNYDNNNNNIFIIKTIYEHSMNNIQ